MTSPLILYQKLIAEVKSNSQTGLSSSLLKRGAFFSAAISCMACSTSLLRLSLFGNDPYSCMNLWPSLPAHRHILIPHPAGVRIRLQLQHLCPCPRSPGQ